MKLKDMVETGGGWSPPRLVIYGDEKSGKTSTAAQAPRPLFLGTDDGRRRLNVDGLPLASNWAQFLEQLDAVAQDAAGLDYGTVVTDTLNGVVDLCAKHVCETQFAGRWSDPKNGFSAWGGNQGWAATWEEFRRVLPLYNRLVDSGLWVVMLAHSTTGHIRNPLSGDYDRWQPAIDRRVWDPIARWADVILRVDYEMTLLEEAGRRRAVSDGTRILRCAASAAESAGCRVGYELPETLPWSWEAIEGHLGKPDDTTAKTLRELWPTMTKDEQRKAEAFLGVGIDDLERAPLHKAKSLINRLHGRKDRTDG